jgi:tetratricopeptide (TPR) repeat protein
LNPATTLYSFIFLAGLLATGLWLIRRQPLVSLGILWFFAGHILESTIIPLELVHEHRNYLPDFGIILAVAAVLANIRLQRLAPVIHVAAAVLLLVVYASTTWLRSAQWSDNINHAIYEAKHHPNSTRAVFAAGRIHGRLALQGVEASIEEAYRYLRHANQLDSTGIMSAITLVRLDYLLDRAVDPQLFEEITNRLANYPLTPSDITSLQDLADCMGNPCEVPQEIFEKIFSTALKDNNSRLLTVYGFYTINKRGDFHKGLELFEQVAELAPNEPQHWKNLINLLIVMARFDDAEQRLDQFRTLKPYGSNESTFRILQEDIENGRKQYSAANSEHEGNG